jgi:hypothetical protein
VPYGESDRGILSQPFVDKVPLLKNGPKKLWAGPQSRLEETPLWGRFVALPENIKLG